ncbi:uncharacterized protein TRIADDRAFT_19492 [Trichoplax adhaerens]|uniref:Rab-GAP TBC domain-containing protein n=1 Tax=Trichoplax adhaerens TaxID=10228 RepID=B3RIB5_TRIAD|nr:hypothetical protein TRIADDRAFT_19492 [Trichoplax adhaerens]EDV28990.1 hypothetical protein TRIADDRAFT_19492 [Trichoplax adhaerens]|eukprot:XP_002108192.1 hypothetical protein TRIADDRAFT_19492 [Trichoplax adhaerens]
MITIISNTIHKYQLETLRELSWNGVPKSFRPKAWRLLSGYLPVNAERQKLTLERKRDEYCSYVVKYYPLRNDPSFQETFRQIQIDIPRTNPLVPLFQQPLVQQVFERVLFIWAMRHPASGYVQGINDLVTPFFIVFLTEYINEVDVETYDIVKLSLKQLELIEADSYWCLTNILDGIQDNYTFAQPGIQKKVQTLKTLVSRVNGKLHLHLEKHNIEYLQFAFRWMNNILMRELPLRCIIRLWDTYQAEPNGFADFHLYVCAAFLNHWSKELLERHDFQNLMILLQNTPTDNWTEREIAVLLAEAFSLKYAFADAPSHFHKKK